MAETLKFGPEWLRNLSSDSHCRPQSPSVPTSRFKLAEHRYTKEEMLSLFPSDIEPPSDLKMTPKILSEEVLEPLGLTPLTDAEQKLLLQMSSNNVTGTSRPPPSITRPTISLSQLRNSDSSRKTRGSGRLDPFYYRSSTTDDDEYVKTRHFNREPWDDSIPSSRGRGLGYSGRSFDDPPDVSRSMAADNWRGPKKKWNDEDTGNWRKQFPSQKPSNRSWREPWEKDRGRSSDDPFREKIFRRSFSSSHAQNNHYDEELEQLPEWSTDDFGGVGTFDATGAFMTFELEKREEELLQKENEENAINDITAADSSTDGDAEDVNNGNVDVTEPTTSRDSHADGSNESPNSTSNGEEARKDKSESSETGNSVASVGADGGFALVPLRDNMSETTSLGELGHSAGDRGDEGKLFFPSGIGSEDGRLEEGKNKSLPGLYGGMSFDVENLVDRLMASNEDDLNQADDNQGSCNDIAANFTHLQQQQLGDGVEASHLFAKSLEGDLQQRLLLEEQLQQHQTFLFQQQQQFSQFQQQQMFSQQQHFQQQQQQIQQQNYIKGFVPPDHEDADKWFYRDPQGEIQGPFSQLEMSEWFSVGYFNMSLLVKQGRDHNFLPVGTLVKLIGSNPFQISYPTSAIMSHLKTQASNNPDQPFDLQQSQQLSQQMQQLHLKQQLDQMKLMQLMQLHPRNELLNKLSTLQLLQTLQQQQQQQQHQQQLHQNNGSRPLLEALNAQSSVPAGDSNALSSLHQQIIQQHLQQQKQQQLSQLLQQQQQLHSYPHRSFSQSSNNEPLPFAGGVTASNSASFLLQTTGSQQAPPNSLSSAWKTANDVIPHNSKAWDKGVMGLELSRPITAQALEQLQYMALEKQQQQQRCDSSASLPGGGINPNSDQSNQLDPISANNMAIGGLREQQLRVLLQQETAMRLAAFSDERQKLVSSVEMMERQKLDELRRRQEKAESLRKLQQQQQQEQLEALKKLKQQQQQNKVNMSLNNTALSLNSIPRQGQQLQRGSSPNFPSSSTAVNHPLGGNLNLQQQSLLQKQQVNKSWSLTNQSWINGGNSHALDTNAGAWCNPVYPQQQYHPPPSHSTTTMFTNTTSNPHHLLDDSYHRSAASMFSSTPPSATNVWLDGSCKNPGLSNFPSQQQVLGNSSQSTTSLSSDKVSRETLALWCESELKDQVPNGNIPSIIQQLLDSSALPEIVNIIKAFFADSDKATGFALGFLDRRNQLASRQHEQHQQQQSSLTMFS